MRTLISGSGRALMIDNLINLLRVQHLNIVTILGHIFETEVINLHICGLFVHASSII